MDLFKTFNVQLYAIEKFVLKHFALAPWLRCGTVYRTPP
ncbi:hypothetical protein T01_874 [Trichinella spiralis]|uniref:Uncharacterized protein n=1 Tax=Trichinella spiralis TaxID=6334 RepID=A0A0V0YTL7_TRISP|nr:hypothetical protein T01_874 [Trichinella spiralis]